MINDKDALKLCKKFCKDLKRRGGHVLRKIVNYKGRPMIYYREPNTYTTDIYTVVF